jgi:hypothetical protein
VPRGGKRPGAGRKPRDDSGSPSQVSVWLTPAEQERLAVVLAELGETNGQVFLRGIKAAERTMRARSNLHLRECVKAQGG